MVAVRKRGARQKSLLLWMRRRYGVVQPSEPNDYYNKRPRSCAGLFCLLFSVKCSGNGSDRNVPGGRNVYFMTVFETVELHHDHCYFGSSLIRAIIYSWHINIPEGQSLQMQS